MKKYLMDTGENSLPAVLSRLTACDSLSFRVIWTSKDLRRGLMAMGHSHVPTSLKSIRQQVLRHGQVIRSVVTADLGRKKKDGERFSVTLNEWTSTRNRRHMNINVHACGGQHWSLGLLRVHGSVPAEKCVTLVEGKLAEFGLSLSQDIVCICTDGASVMKKVGKIVTTEQQLCYTHGVQLAVLDVLYKSRSFKATVAFDEELESMPVEDDIHVDVGDDTSDATSPTTEQGL